MPNPLICPPQKAPLSEEGSRLISKLWWLYFKRLAAAGGSGSGSTQVHEVALTAPTTAITSPVASPTEGDRLAVVITQDATGGRQITWSTEFATLTTVNIQTEPNKRSIFDFVARSDNLWWPVSAPFLEE